MLRVIANRGVARKCTAGSRTAGLPGGVGPGIASKSVCLTEVSSGQLSGLLLNLPLAAACSHIVR